MNSLPKTDYWRAYQAKSTGVLKWDDFDRLWAIVGDHSDGWFINDFSESPEKTAATKPELLGFLRETEMFIKARSDKDYCGCVYTDDLNAPTFIRIFDPKNMGSACGGSGARIFPKWTLSRIRPDTIPVAVNQSGNRRLLGKILSRTS